MYRFLLFRMRSLLWQGGGAFVIGVVGAGLSLLVEPLSRTIALSVGGLVLAGSGKNSSLTSAGSSARRTWWPHTRRGSCSAAWNSLKRCGKPAR